MKRWGHTEVPPKTWEGLKVEFTKSTEMLPEGCFQIGEWDPIGDGVRIVKVSVRDSRPRAPQLAPMPDLKPLHTWAAAEVGVPASWITILHLAQEEGEEWGCEVVLPAKQRSRGKSHIKILGYGETPSSAVQDAVWSALLRRADP
jgi:hypothetical protein